MTNHWIDLQNSDAIFVIGCNPAENHPISFRWITEGMKRGAKLIYVDPRYTRTASKADIFAPIRAATDTAFWGGFISYIIENGLYQEDYVREYTNASYIVSKDYSFTDGLFSGFNEKEGSYDRSSWTFETDENGVSRKDFSLKHPRCVLQVMRGHYKRYDLQTVSAITGIAEEKLREVWDAFGATGRRDKAGTILYALGQTQSTTGVQRIRALCMVQLLLGNIGIAGGGVNALRGESNVQGTTDLSLLVDNLPGYLAPMKVNWPTLQEYIKANTPVSRDPKSVNWWGNYDKYIVSYLKSLYPAHDHELSYTWVPKADSVPIMEYSWLKLFDRMSKGGMEGAFIWGMNPAVGGANAGKNREALKKLDWMVAVNLFQNETSEFWKAPGVDPKDVQTEVFFLPAAMSVEKEGSVANSGRWLQWRYEAAPPLGDSKSDGDIILLLQDELKKLYARPGSETPEPILNLNLDFKTDGKYDAVKAAKRINGQFLKDVTIGGKTWKAGQQAPAFSSLQADGATSSGCWIYCGSFTEEGNMMARHSHEQTPEQARIGLFPNWAYSWPANRRILYSRASLDPQGRPWDPKRPVIAWDGKSWKGDVPDGGAAPDAAYPFIMIREGRAQLFGPGRLDGPLPEHYEPFESPLEKNPLSSRRVNPMAISFEEEKKAFADPAYPYVCTTYRVTEQWQSRSMTRNCSWLNEAQPGAFCEIDPELAAKLGVANGEEVIVESVRGKVHVTALVTRRIKPLRIMGKMVHTVGLCWQFGWKDRKHVPYDAANMLVPSVGDPNSGIPESKGFMVNLRRAGG